MRNAYIKAVVSAEERVAVASIQMLGRSVTATVGPSAGTALWSAVSSSVSFVACSGIKINYDLSL